MLSDVNANVPALRAVLEEAGSDGAELFVFTGNLTWGAEPEQTAELVTALGDRAVCLRGNTDRALLDLATATRAPRGPREAWMLNQHSIDTVRLLAGFAFGAVVGVQGLGDVRLCHGSPRSDTELVTPRTPESRFAVLAHGMDERTLVTGHTQLQFDRELAGCRSVGPGGIGTPHHTSTPGTAHWAMLGPGVELRRTRYDVSEAARRGMRAGDPSAEIIAWMLYNALTPAEATAEAERLVFAG
ncbi:metallophosphoesterase family protein [Streptomyces platensis]